MQIREALQNIGLNEKQSSVYEALLQLGRASAYAIAEKSGLKKPTTYVVLEELVDKGLVRRIPRLRKQHFEALSPEQAFAAAEERLAVAKQTLPELLALTKGEKTKVNAMYFEGVSGIKKMLQYRMKELKGNEVVGFYATDKNADPELTRFFKEEFGSDMHKARITMRGIAPDDEALSHYRETDTQYGREMKVIPKETYSSEVAIDCIGDLVRIQDYKNLQGTILENPDVAKTFREIFEMVWKKN